jgi:UDP-N-acetylglucosamine acyltransferase
LSIHSTAIVDPGASIHPTAVIGPYAVIGDEVTLGAGTRVQHHASVLGPAVLGRDNHLFPFASLGTAPQDLGYKDEPTRLEVGDRNVFREFVTVNRGTVKGGGITRIGNDCYFMSYAHVAHDCYVGNDVIMANSAPSSAVLSQFTSLPVEAGCR